MTGDARDYQGEGYVRVASLSEIEDPGCRAVEIDGRPLVLVRRGGRVTALDNCCPHAGAPLSEGFIEGDNIVCAWHGWSFDVESGLSSDVAGMAVATCPTIIDGDDVFVRPR